ncbi:MAG: hypothetical protein Q8K51_14825, partial [Nitrospirota bacterium]|nr:hypothetical protein [Nitrospirota bacterium]
MKHSCLKETQKAMKMSYSGLTGVSRGYGFPLKNCGNDRKEEYFQVNIRHKVSKEIHKLMFLIFFLIFNFSLLTFNFSPAHAES